MGTVSVRLLILLFFISNNSLFAQWNQIKNLSGKLDFEEGTKTAIYDSILIVSGHQFIEGSTNTNYKKSIVANISFNQGLDWKPLKIPINYSSGTKTHTIGIYRNNIYFHLSDTIFLTKDFGETWLKQMTPSTPLYDQGRFIFLDSIALFIDQKYPDIVLKTKVGENNWQTDETFPIGTSEVAASKDTIFCLTNNELFYSTNKRISWVKNTLPTPRAWIYQVPSLYFDKNKLYYSSGLSLLYVSSDYGKNWVSSSDVPPGSDVVVNGIIHRLTKEGIYLSNNDGRVWTNMSSGWKRGYNLFQADGNFVIKLLYSEKDSTLYTSGRIFRKRIRDTTWTFCNNLEDASDMPIRIKKYNDTTLVGYSPRGHLYYSTNKGLKWSFFDNNFQVVDDFYGNSDGLIVVKNHLFVRPNENFKAIYVTKDFGKTWSVAPSFPYFNSYQVVGDTIFICKSISSTGANSHQIFYSIPPYTNWTNIISVRSPNFLYHNGYIYVMRENNYSTSKFSLSNNRWEPLRTQIYHSYGFAAAKNRLYILGSLDSFNLNRNIFVSENYGDTWVSLSMPNVKNLSRFDIIGDSILYMTGILKPSENLGGFVVSKNGGKSWGQFITGLQTNKNAWYLLDIPNATCIDDKIFLYSRYSGLWIRDTSILNSISIFGSVVWDKNANGIRDFRDIPIKDVLVYSDKGATLTDSLGLYELIVEANNSKDTLRIVAPNNLSEKKPEFYTIQATEANKNFLIKMPEFSDVSINLDAATPTRPGYRSQYFCTVTNRGTLDADGIISLKYELKQKFIDASTVPESNSAQVLTWRFSKLPINRSIKFSATFRLDSNTLYGSRVVTNAQVILISSNDSDLNNNFDTLNQTVVGAFDPNDKQVTFSNSKRPPSVIDPSTELIYTIRFQNTGNYPADFVKITDTLSDKLDLTTFRMIAASHDYTVNIRNKNVLIFDFNPIYLPDSIRDEKGSHGFVKFAIKPKKTLTKDEVIKNTAFIYFDYNPAIVTNTVETANSKVNKIFTPSVSEGILRISPNPAHNILTFEIDNSTFKEGSLSIYDISGRLMMTQKVVNNRDVINIENLGSGEYICLIKSKDNSVYVNKFIKMN